MKSALLRSELFKGLVFIGPAFAFRPEVAKPLLVF